MMFFLILVSVRQEFVAQQEFVTRQDRDQVNLLDFDYKNNTIALPFAKEKIMYNYHLYHFLDKLFLQVKDNEYQLSYNSDYNRKIEKHPLHFRIYYINSQVIKDLSNLLSQIGDIRALYKDFYCDTQTFRFCDEIVDRNTDYFYHSKDAIAYDMTCEYGYFYFNNIVFTFFSLDQEKHYNIYLDSDRNFIITELNLYLNITVKDAFLLLSATIGKQIAKELTYESLDGKWLCIACAAFSKPLFSYLKNN